MDVVASTGDKSDPFAQFIALCEVAQMLGVSENTVLRWHTQHGLPLMRRGPRGRIMGDRQAIAVWSRRFYAMRVIG